MKNSRISLPLTAALFAFSATSAVAGPPWFRPGGGSVHGGGGFHAAPPAYHGGGVRPGWGGRGGYGGPWFGRSARALPYGYRSYAWHGSPYYLSGGMWYRPWGGWYYGCYPPIGLALATLPFGYETFWWGGMRYYGFDDVYYTDAPAGGYVVADPPPNRAPRAADPVPGTPDAAALDALLIVPLKGQGEDQMKGDRANARRYALEESGYDPARSDPNDPGTPRARRAYLRAMKEYLESRGYSVK